MLQFEVTTYQLPLVYLSWWWLFDANSFLQESIQVDLVPVIYIINNQNVSHMQNMGGKPSCTIFCNLSKFIAEWLTLFQLSLLGAMLLPTQWPCFQNTGKISRISCKHHYKSSNSCIYFVKKAFTRKLNGAFVLSKVQKDFRLPITGMRVARKAHNLLISEKSFTDV